MILSGVDRIDGVSAKISLRKKQPQVLLNVPPEELITRRVCQGYSQARFD